ncbi:permease [bacterium SCSIO 12643]|nr:permease [bacterium SCSIO 12643]
MDAIVKFVSTFFTEFIYLFAEMAPYLILGFALAGILHVYFPKHKVAKYLGRKNLISVFNAAMLGIPLPLCSCGVIPTGISFNKNGASKGATVSFLISTPQTGVDSILITYSLLGLPFALIRPIAAFITGIFGGAITNAVDDTEENLYQNEPEVHIRGSKFQAALKYAFVEFLQDISKWLMIGLVIAAFISAIIPDGFIENNMSNPFVNMLIVLIASIPMYVCATGSVPIAAALMMKGLSPGAAFVFLMAGPATNAATMTVIKQTMGTKTLISYLSSIIGGALLIGLAIDQMPTGWFLLPGMEMGSHNHGAENLDWFSILSAIVLATLLLNGLRLKYFPTTIKRDMSENEKVFSVEGMTCNHCKSSVEKNLSKLNQIEYVEADLASKTVVVKGNNIQASEIEQSINDLGFEYKGEKA